MKNIIVVLFILYFLYGCKKPELPPASQTGANTFGMLVNGSLWVHDCVLCPIAGFNPNGVLHVSSRNSNNDRIQFWVMANGTGTYKINKRWYGMADTCFVTTHYSENNNCYSYKLIDSTSSSITITKYDTIGRIISATFYMTLNNYQGGQLNITEGRFDSSY